MDPATIACLDSIRSVLDYAEIGEERDHEEQDDEGRADHVLVHIRRVRAWLDSTTAAL